MIYIFTLIYVGLFRYLFVFGYCDRRVCYGGKVFELRDTAADHDSRCSRPDGSSYEDCALRALNCNSQDLF